MPIVEIKVDAVEPFADGQAFGEAGAYVRIAGVAKGEIDPAAPENHAIADLDKAPRNASGMVEHEADFFILRPAEQARGSGVLVYDVTNRGRKMIFNLLDDAAGGADTNNPRAARDVGLAFTLGRGWSLVWSGWDSGAPRANNGMTARLPPALEGGGPIVRRIRDEFHIGTRAPGKGDVVRLNYAAVSTDKGKARLAVRDRESDARTEIPPEAWEFVDNRSIRLLPQGALFAPYKIYEIWYEAAGSTVIGVGFAATRDLVSFLRHGDAGRAGAPSPMTGVRHALAFGVSQSGRFLRHFLELGMNDDGRGRRVFDGVLTHVAGAGKVFANHSFAMPGRTGTQHEDRLYPENWFPFSQAVATDPFSGKTGAILAGRPTDPKIIEVNSSTEYWQKGASLVHVDPTGRRDLELPSNARAYMIAGTQHGGRPGVDPSPGPCVNPRNPHSATPALRALLAALEDWVRTGAEPPPSRVPSIAQGDAIDAEAVRMPTVPGFALGPRRQPHRAAGRLGQPAGAARQFLRNQGLRGRRRRQRGRRDQAAADRRAAWNLHRLERLPGAARRARRPRRVADRVRPNAAGARGGRRPAPVARRTLWQPRCLCRKGEGRRRSARGRPAAAAGRRRGLCQGRRGMRPVLTAAVRGARSGTAAAPRGSSPPGQSRRRRPV